MLKILFSSDLQFVTPHRSPNIGKTTRPLHLAFRRGTAGRFKVNERGG
jgi:hypothetical protein